MQQKLFTTISKSVLFLGLFFVALLFSVEKSYGEAAITVGDDVKIKFGVLLQGQIDATEDTTYNNEYSTNIFLRRARVLIGGQLAPGLTFFTDFDNPNLGKQSANDVVANQTSKNLISTGFNTLDAVLTWKIFDPLMFDMGLILVPDCRNCLQSAAMLMPIDYAHSSFVEQYATGSDTGRDTGLQLRSYLLDDKLEVRLGAFQGYRVTNGEAGAQGATAALRTIVRLQYDLLDAEKGMFYTGTYLGQKRVMAVGVSYDEQSTYRSQDIDFFFDMPISDGLAVTAQLDHIRWMPGQVDGTDSGILLVDSIDWVAEAGIYITGLRLQPFLQYEDQQNYTEVAPDVRYFQGGVGYYFSGYNGNLKLSAGYKDAGTSYANEVTLQLQGFYF